MTPQPDHPLYDDAWHFQHGDGAPAPRPHEMAGQHGTLPLAHLLGALEALLNPDAILDQVQRAQCALLLRQLLDGLLAALHEQAAIPVEDLLQACHSVADLMDPGTGLDLEERSRLAALIRFVLTHLTPSLPRPPAGTPSA